MLFIAVSAAGAREKRMKRKVDESFLFVQRCGSLLVLISPRR